jgi:uncharacterized protein
MMDKFYNIQSKSHFYLGMISKVSEGTCIVQVENLSLFSTRMIGLEDVAPSTINYMVAIESSGVFFVGIVFQNQISNSDSTHIILVKRDDERVFPEIMINVLAVYSSRLDMFELPGFMNPGLTDKVYVASRSMIEKYLNSLDINYYKNTSLPAFSVFASNGLPIRLESSTLFDRHLMIIGATGGGKSTTSLSILDALCKAHKKFMIIDATGEYQDSFADKEVKKICLGRDAKITPGSLTITQWISFLEASPGIQAPSLMKAIISLRYQKKNKTAGVYKKNGKSITIVSTEMSSLTEEDKEFDLKYLAAQLVEESVQESSKNKGFYEENSFSLNANQILIDRLNYKLQLDGFKEFFSNDSTDSLLDIIRDFLINESRLMINVSSIDTRDSTGGMIIDLISHTILNARLKDSKPFVMFVDEVHRYAKTNDIEGENYYPGLILLSREGRKNGQYLFLTTQSPHDVSKVLLGQMGSLIVHRMTQPDELNSIYNYLREGDLTKIKKLRKGEAILTSINLLHSIQMTIIKTGRQQHNHSPEL